MRTYVITGVLIILSVLANLMHWGPIPLFALSAAAIIPLAGILGKATEEVAKRQGPAIGGLLNATFGNATELILAIVALRSGGALVEMVKASITGSIIGNLLLVLGLAIVVGGMRYKSLSISVASSGLASSQMMLAVVGLVVPATFAFVRPNAPEAVLESLSLVVAAILLLVYVLGLVFSLWTHKHVFSPEDDESEPPEWPLKKALGVLLGATLLVVLESELLVHAIEALIESMHLSAIFLGAVVVAVVGNAAEHAVAIIMARKGKMDLSYQIACGSSTQVALFVAPFLVFVSLWMGKPMNLLFTSFEVLSIVVTMFIVSQISADGETNWFEGVQLLAVYAILCVMFYFL
ncbi:MAG: calcium/proton exchanger [Armatimonadetes bacterium]|nr:calcium/proton exchanger [Armatimonadota bacterium]